MKVDTGKIEGYADMSAEEKLAALEAYEFEDPAPPKNDGEIERLKAALSKSNSENAEWKKKYNSKLSDEEAKAAKEAEEREAMEKELNTLRKEKAIGTYKAAYLELGYDADMATENAAALHAGDFTKVFANQKKFIEAQKKAAVAGALDKQPTLTGGAPVSGQNVENQAVSSFRKAAGLG